MTFKYLATALAATLAIAATGAVVAQDRAAPAPVAPAAKVTAAIVTVPPGGQTGWHSHEVPLFGYVLEGVLTVDYGSKGIKTYKTGDSWMEAVNWPHNGMNRGTVPVKLLAVYMGGGDKANTVKVPTP